MIADFFFSFGNHLHENPRLPTTPFYFLSLFYVSSLAFLPRFAFTQNREWAGPSLVWHHLSFSHASAPELLGCQTNLPTMGLPPLSVQCNRCWHVGGYHESKSAFHALLLTPHWSPSLCVRLGVKSSSVWSCACTARFAVPLHLLIECCFEMLTLYKRKRKCKKKKKKKNNTKHTQTNP